VVKLEQMLLEVVSLLKAFSHIASCEESNFLQSFNTDIETTRIRQTWRMKPNLLNLPSRGNAITF
jgi:hypothetical protein